MNRNTLRRALTTLALASLAGTAGAATMMANNSNKGSMLVFPHLVFAVNTDTLITLVNDGSTDVAVKCYYRTSEPLPTPLSSKVDVSQIKHTMDFTLTLTRNQPLTWSAFTGVVLGGTQQIAQPFMPFPDGSSHLTGELKCFAIGTDASGNVGQINFNQLFGNATIVWAGGGGQAWQYNAWAFQALGGTAAQGQFVGTPGTLNLDGTISGYDMCPNILVADFQPTGAATPAAPPVFTGGFPETLISIAACNQDLTQVQRPVITKYTYTFWNEDESSRTGTHECGDSYYEQWFQPVTLPGGLSGSTVPGGQMIGMPLAQFSSLGTFTAYMRVESVADEAVCAGSVHVGMVGAIMHYNNLLRPGSAYFRGSNMIGRGTQAGVMTWTPGPADSFKR